MEEMIAAFPDQLQDALQIAEDAQLSSINKDKVQNILIVGLGGSGIGGNFAQAICRSTATVPITVSKRYNIPGWVSENTLVICNSYSGNTEETLNAFRAAMNTDAQIICVSSGGKLLSIAEDHNLPFIKLPDNWESPRACLGYSLVQQLRIMDELEMIEADWESRITASRVRLEKESHDIRKRAQYIAQMIADKQIVIYAEDAMEPLAVRWRQQINENAKTLCWHHVIPEMNHNELVGWRDDNNVAVILLRSKLNYARNAMRMDINKEIIGNYAASLIEIYGKGGSMIEHMLYLVHLGDWMSYELAKIKNRDVVEVKVIDYLKSELGKI